MFEIPEITEFTVAAIPLVSSTSQQRQLLNRDAQ